MSFYGVFFAYANLHILFFPTRLRKDFFGGAWCPKATIAPGVREWIQIDLKRSYRITRTATQGRYGSGHGKEYAEAFKLEYWRPEFGNGEDSWRTYKNHTGHSVRNMTLTSICRYLTSGSISINRKVA